jgi:hypothetical protein
MVKTGIGKYFFVIFIQLLEVEIRNWEMSSSFFISNEIGILLA